MGYKIALETGEVHDVPRVTEVIRAGMARPALTAWELREAVGFALGNPGRDVASTISAWRRERARHTERGTAVHRFIQATCTGATPPALLASQRGYKLAFTDFMVEHDLDLRGALVEQTLTDDRVSVAGTADLITNGHLYDWKTVEKKKGEGIWPDQLAQLGAYASMVLCVDDGRPGRPAPAVNAASVVRLYADGSHSVETIRGEELREAIALWYAVRRVARATMHDRDNIGADPKEKKT
jgi:hypothetical protein